MGPWFATLGRSDLTVRDSELAQGSAQEEEINLEQDHAIHRNPVGAHPYQPGARRSRRRRARCRNGAEDRGEARIPGAGSPVVVHPTPDSDRRRDGPIHRHRRLAHPRERRGRADRALRLHRLHPRRRRGPQPAADHVRLQRRAGVVIDLAAHGDSGTAAGGGRGRRLRAAAAGQSCGQRIQHHRRHRPGDGRPGRYRLQQAAGRSQG